MAGSAVDLPRDHIYLTIRGTNKGNYVFSPNDKPMAYRAYAFKSLLFLVTCLF
jgi:sugar-specific transcriptional regulator TrmB